MSRIGSSDSESAVRRYEANEWQEHVAQNPNSKPPLAPLFIQRLLPNHTATGTNAILRIFQNPPKIESPTTNSPLIPAVDDPRAILLPQSTTQDGEIFFVNGLNSVTEEYSVLRLQKKQDQWTLRFEIYGAQNGKLQTVIELETPCHQDGNKFYFASSPFEESSVFELTLNSDNSVENVARYPSYLAAGLEAPFKKSVFISKPRAIDKTFHVTLKLDAHNSIPLRIVESPDGQVEQIIHSDFTLGSLAKSNDRIFGHEYWELPAYGLKIQLKKISDKRGVFNYRVYVYHDVDSTNAPIHQQLTPQNLTAENLDWKSVIPALCDNLRIRLTLHEIDTLGLRTELYNIRDTYGMAVVAEVIMTLFLDAYEKRYPEESTHMQIVNVMRLSDTEFLPLPPDSRAFAADMDIISSLLNFFAPTTLSGFVLQQLLESAKQVYPNIPANQLGNLWLYATNPTQAEKVYMARGADTPDSIPDGYHVGRYRRILDESRSPLLSTHKTRLEQREHIRSLLQSNTLESGFRNFLGYQLELAENFDLLLLESGSLYYNANLLRSIQRTNNGQYLQAVVDGSRKIINIPKSNINPPNEIAPVLLDHDLVQASFKLAPIHNDDNFLFTTIAGRSQGQDSGTLSNGNILIRTPDNKWKVPSPREVRESMNGLLDLPIDYLNTLSENPPLANDSVDINRVGATTYKLSDYKYQLGGVSDFTPTQIRMIRYDIKIGEQILEVYIPSPHSKIAQTFRKNGFYVATEDDLPRIATLYNNVTKKGFLPKRANLILMPGEIKTADNDGGALGFYTWKTEDLVLSSHRVGSSNSVDAWASIRLFNTGRHEIAHAFKRSNPWITSLLYRAMALDGFTMDYGNTHVEEYFAVLMQHYFDQPLHKNRFRYGYRLIYTLQMLREAGVDWDGPHNNRGLTPELERSTPRNIDGTYGCIRLLATGQNPFVAIPQKVTPSNSTPPQNSGGPQNLRDFSQASKSTHPNPSRKNFAPVPVKTFLSPEFNLRPNLLSTPIPQISAGAMMSHTAMPTLSPMPMTTRIFTR